jgi:hypothetical protein
MTGAPSRPEISRWLVAAVVVGLALQGYHYLRRPVMWHDEAYITVNILTKSAAELLGPLRYAQAAPPLFLWAERGLCLLLGDDLYVLRLVPFVASCLALLLFAAVTRHWLPNTAAAWVVLLFGTSDRFLRHGCEVKPYAVDLFVSSAVLAAYTFTRGWPLRRRLALYALAAPPLLWLSYPACFLYAGLLVALLPEVWRELNLRTGLLYALWAGVVAASFGLLVIGPIRAQHNAVLDAYWAGCFPDPEHVWRLPVWVATSTLDILHYACNPIGAYLGVFAAIGAWRLWRGGGRRLLLLLTAPLGAALLAAALRSYPYGGSRLQFYAAQLVLLLIGVGLAPVLDWLRQRPRLMPLGWALGVLLLCPAGNSTVRLFVPWSRPDAATLATEVLARRHDDEPVLCGEWQAFYYFRHARGSLFLAEERSPCEVPGPLWVVVVGESDAEREAGLRRLAEGRSVMERCDARMATALRLGPANPYASGAASARR